MNGTWPVAQKGLDEVCGNSKILKVPLGFWSQLWEGPSNDICDGKQLYAAYNVLQQMEDVTKGLPELSSNAKNHYLGSRRAV